MVAGRTEVISIVVGDALARLREMPDNSVHCCITSPPYWGLRDYQTLPQIWDAVLGCEHEWGDAIPGDNRGGSGTPTDKNNRGEGYGRDSVKGQFCRLCGAWLGSLGLEPTPELYISHLAQVFREVKRVLHPSGTLWLNLGDSFSGKQLMMMPARVALALQADGWWLRSEIIWHKPNCMPESVTDRPTKSHEQIFLLAKSQRYFYDADAIREPNGEWNVARNPTYGQNVEGVILGRKTEPHNGLKEVYPNPTGRNRRSVWAIPTQPYSEAHFAVFPPALVTPMVMAGTSEAGCCSACGNPWERVTEKKGKSTYRKIIDEQGITHEDMLHMAERNGTALKSGGQKGWGGTRNANGTAPHLDAVPTITTGWLPTCACNDAAIPCTVLDPFAGSGTTLSVAKGLGRDAIGIELNPNYAAMAQRRVDETQPPLFLVDTVAAVPEPEITQLSWMEDES